MNKFDEAKELVIINKKIESSAFEFAIDYKPMNDNLDPNNYAEHGFIKGQQELIIELIAKRIINPHDLWKLANE